MTDTLSLRKRIDKALDENPSLIGSTLDAARKEIIKTVLPVVEQEIQQEREKWHAEHAGPWWATELAAEGAESKAQIAALQEAFRELRAAIISVWADAEECEECEALDEVKGPMGGDGAPCAVHRSDRLYRALLAADEVLGPCRCGHKRSEHHDEDTTRCRVCDCQGFTLAPLRETPAPPQEPQDPRYKHILSGDYYMPGHKDETKESIDPMTDPIIDVQTTLDDWLASNPEAQKYVRKIYYVPDGAQIPRDVTHMNRLTSIDYPDLELRLGVVATLETAALANLILGLIERTADDPKA